MLAIRLTRVGKRNKAYFRLIVQDHDRNPRSRAVEIIGNFDPHHEHGKGKFIINEERLKYWLSQGAQPSATVHNKLIDLGLLQGAKHLSWKPKRKEGDAATPNPPAPKTEEVAKTTPETVQS
ncbi:MAG: 30S ribosomal protein S16 [Patescibacteria group bacterium]